MILRADRLIIFAKAPVPGRVKTRLCPPLTPGEAAALHAAFIRDTLDMAVSGGPYVVTLAYTPRGSDPVFREVLGSAPVELAPQEGRDLGLRMHGSLARAIAAGAKKAALIGTDIPALPANFIRDAFLALDGSDLVLGPAEDGGYYLVALKKPEKRLFTGITWSTPGVLADTLARAKALGLKVSLLPAMTDVDTPADLYALLDGPLPPETRRFVERLRPRLAAP